MSEALTPTLPPEQPKNPEVFSDLSLKDLAEQGEHWELLERVTLTPGYNLESQFLPLTSPVAPIDKYNTSARLGTGTVLRLVRTERPKDDNPPENQPKLPLTWKGLLQRALGKREAALAKQSSTEPIFMVMAQISNGKVSHDRQLPYRDSAKISCSPQELPRELLNIANTAMEVELEEQLLIKPDYSNLADQPPGPILTTPEGFILTTSDLFCIVIQPGAKIIVQHGGQANNVNLIISQGEIAVPCSPDITIPLARKYQPPSSGPVLP